MRGASKSLKIKGRNGVPRHDQACEEGPHSLCSSFSAVSLPLPNDDNADARSLVPSFVRSIVRASVKAVASSAFYHRLLAGCVRARQPAWLPRWCRRCLWNRSVEIINGPLALRVGIVRPTKKRTTDTEYNNLSFLSSATTAKRKKQADFSRRFSRARSSRDYTRGSQEEMLPSVYSAPAFAESYLNMRRTWPRGSDESAGERVISSGTCK